MQLKKYRIEESKVPEQNKEKNKVVLSRKTSTILVLLFLGAIICSGTVTLVSALSGTNIISEVRQFIVDKVPPQPLYVNITPDAAYTNSTLSCTVLAYDTTTNMTINYSWIINTTSYISEEDIGLPDYFAITNLTQLTQDYFVKHDNISCNVSFTDSAGNNNFSSELIEILNYPPRLKNLSYPTLNDEFFTNRTPTFNWTNASDIDNDSITYTLQIDINNNFDDGAWFTKSNITDNKYFFNDSELVLDITYYWRVQANDSENVSDWIGPWNFTLKPSAVLTLVNYSIEFGLMSLGDRGTTEDSSPYPLILQNDGNVRLDVNISSAPLWTSDTVRLNSSYYQYKANNSMNLEESFVYYQQGIWQNMSNTPTTLLYALNYTEHYDFSTVDIGIEVPTDEPPGAKNGTVIFTASEV